MRTVLTAVATVRLWTPSNALTIRPASDGAESAFTLEWGERRVRVPVRAVP